MGRDQGKGESIDSMGFLINMLIEHFVCSPLFLHQIALDELTYTWWRLSIEINLFALKRLWILEAKRVVGCKRELSDWWYPFSSAADVLSPVQFAVCMLCINYIAGVPQLLMDQRTADTKRVLCTRQESCDLIL